MRTMLSIVCVLAMVACLSADDKKDTTLKGQVCCAKCILKKADSCNAAIVVRDGDNEEIYYFDSESQEKFGKESCKEKRMAKVTGTTMEKDGKKWITVTKVEYEKKDSPLLAQRHAADCTSSPCIWKNAGFFVFWLLIASLLQCVSIHDCPRK